MTHPQTASWLLAAVTVLALATGCSPDPTDKDAPLPTRPLADVTRQADTDAKLIAEAAAAEMTLRSDTPTPCTGRGGETTDDDRWSLSTSFSLSVASSDQHAAISRIKTTLERQSWTITEESSYAADTRGMLSARNPATGHTLNLFTTKSLTSIAVTMASPCYQPAPGENPLNDCSDGGWSEQRSGAAPPRSSTYTTILDAHGVLDAAGR